MTINIALGWWIAPAAVTALAFLWVYLKQDRKVSGGLGEPARLMGNLFLYLIATIPALIAWLIWSLAA